MKEVFVGLGVGDAIAVHAFAGSGVEIEAIESLVSEAPGILRGNSIDAYAEERMRLRLEKFDDLSADAGNFGQIFGIGDAGQAGFLVVGTQTGEIVFFFL